MRDEPASPLLNVVRRLLRLPIEPRIPPRADPASTRVFRPANRFYWYQLCRTQLTAVIGIWFGVWAFGWIPELAIEILAELPDALAGRLAPWLALDWLDLLEVLAIFGFAGQLLVTAVLLHLDFHHRWYLVTDRSLRVHSGLWNVEERTMTLGNIQTTSIRRGPLQQLFGLSDLRVESAGGGSSGSDDNDGHPSHGLHVTVFRGVANSAQIRELIGERIRKLARSNTVEIDDKPTVPIGSMTATIEAAKSLLSEATALAETARSWRGALVANPGDRAQLELTLDSRD